MEHDANKGIVEQYKVRRAAHERLASRVQISIMKQRNLYACKHAPGHHQAGTAQLIRVGKREY